MTVKLIWITPDADGVISYCARVSNPANQENPEILGLLKYCAKHKHFSIFEMATAVIEINTSRDIGRQILRHRSFSFQEFSGRYQSYDKLEEAPLRECRLQDTKNRQNSLNNYNTELEEWWENTQIRIAKVTKEAYEIALEQGMAKEQARVLLPEGLTSSRLYMNGTMRSWIFYLKQRLHPSCQKEHRIIAQQALDILRTVAPVTMEAFFPS